MHRYVLILLGLVGIHAMPQMAEGATKVACVGDSITQGSGWCEALGTKLGATFTVNNFGVSGTTLMKSGDSPYWECNKFIPSHDFVPDVVVIMLGTNDSKPQNWSHQANFAADYEALIQSYTALSSKPRIYACLPPGAGVNSYSISGTVIHNEIIPLIRQAASNQSVPLIDVHAAFGGVNLDTSLFSSTADQVHPNAEGAQVIRDTVFQVLAIDLGAAGGGAGGVGGTSSTSSGSSAIRMGAGGTLASTTVVSSGGTALSGGESNQGGKSHGSDHASAGGSKASSDSLASNSGGSTSALTRAKTGGSPNSAGLLSNASTAGGAIQALAGGAGSALRSTTLDEVSGSGPGADACACRAPNRESSRGTLGWVALSSLAVVLRRRHRTSLLNE